MTYVYHGVSAKERPDGYVHVKNRGGNYVAITPRIEYAVAKFIEAVKEST
jgi:hypothetical protein